MVPAGTSRSAYRRLFWVEKAAEAEKVFGPHFDGQVFFFFGLGGWKEVWIYIPGVFVKPSKVTFSNTPKRWVGHHHQQQPLRFKGHVTTHRSSASHLPGIIWS